MPNVFTITHLLLAELERRGVTYVVEETSSKSSLQMAIPLWSVECDLAPDWVADRLARDGAEVVIDDDADTDAIITIDFVENDGVVTSAPLVAIAFSLVNASYFDDGRGGVTEKELAAVAGARVARVLEQFVPSNAAWYEATAALSIDYAGFAFFQHPDDLAQENPDWGCTFAPDEAARVFAGSTLIADVVARLELNGVDGIEITRRHGSITVVEIRNDGDDVELPRETHDAVFREKLKEMDGAAVQQLERHLDHRRKKPVAA